MSQGGFVFEGHEHEEHLGTSLLSRLEPSMIAELLKVGELVHVRAGEWLFRTGDEGDALYLVDAGRLEVLSEEDGRETLIRVLVAGDAVGELAMLTRAPRSASVRAVRDSELLRVPHDACMRLVSVDGAFALAMLASIGEKLRLRVSLDTGVRESRVLAVLPLDGAAPVGEIADGVARAVEGWGRVARVMPGSVSGDEASWGAAVDAYEREHDYVILVADRFGEDERWGQFCARQADRVLAVVGDAAPGTAVARPDWDLVVFDRAARTATHRKWLDLIQPRTHHTVRTLGSTAEIERMTRRVLGRSVGLVLSGGGARGLAHLGVLDVLTEAGVPLDRVGGTSIGAFVGALIAAGKPPRELARICRVELAERHPFRDFTWPRIALIRARRAALMLDRVFGTAHLEDLPLDCFTVSADLSTAEVVVQRRGPVVDAVGASMSLPGLAPPVRSGSRLLVDGGVLNNVPVDVMVASEEGPVIAVDVMTRSPLGSSQRMPSIIETLARASVIGSHHQAAVRLGAASAVIEPEVGKVGLLDFTRFDEIVEAGRRAARLALEAGTLPTFERP
ncbi:MAG: patatin-like phospholipase family protein [Acidimicrobiia bacterium]